MLIPEIIILSIWKANYFSDEFSKSSHFGLTISNHFKVEISIP
jgi:hypothetical protein